MFLMPGPTHEGVKGVMVAVSGGLHRGNTWGELWCVHRSSEKNGPSRGKRERRGPEAIANQNPESKTSLGLLGLQLGDWSSKRGWGGT